MWHEKIVTPEKQQRILAEVIAVYRHMGVRIEYEEKSVPLHSLIATQDAIERDKFDLVLEKNRGGELEVPVLVEEQYIGERYRRYLIVGHCRTRSCLELGQRSIRAYVLWSPGGDFKSNFVAIAAQYGNVLVKNLKMV